MAVTARASIWSRSADDSVLATCRLLFVGPTVQFSRLAVQRDARRRGIASRLLELADQETRAGGARRIVLHAQTYARSLYEGAGYQPRGGCSWSPGSSTSRWRSACGPRRCGPVAAR